MENKAQIKEFFTSIQGEGCCIGYKQLFVRFSGCNLKCNYCDTLHQNGEIYDVQKFLEKISSQDTKNIHSISLTGGEPLLYADFLKEALPQFEHKIFLETNGTLPEKFAEIADNIDFLSLDLKIKSSTGLDIDYKKCENFLKIANEKNIKSYLKVVFNESISDSEIKIATQIAEKYGVELILQPQMNDKKLAVSTKKILEICEKANNLYKNVRLIPQTHNFLNID